MQQKFFVYIIQDPATLEIFYIGKGTKNRHKQHLTEAKKWPFKPKPSTNVPKVKRIKQIIDNNQKPIIIKVFQTDDESAALNEERRLILLIGRKPNGPLLNQTDGGEGTSGYKHTPEVKRLFSKQRKGKVVTRHSEEYKAKLRYDNPGARATQKEVIQLNLDGSVHTIHPSWRRAAESSGIPKSTLSNNIKPGGLPINGFFWRYKDSTDYVDGKILNADELIRRRNLRDQNKCNRRCVEQLYDNQVVAQFITVTEAANTLNLNYNKLWSAITRNKKYKGYYWRYAR